GRAGRRGESRAGGADAGALPGRRRGLRAAAIRAELRRRRRARGAAGAAHARHELGDAAGEARGAAMSLPRLSIRRPVAVAMFFAAVVMLGLLSATRLPIDLLPDVAYP